MPKGSITAPRCDLIELARDLELSVEDLIRRAEAGQFTIHVIADNWKGQSKDSVEQTVMVDGPVDLLPADLQKSLNA